ncbi:hypothetical protein DEIPH_ctg011orf0009 [Deinococcus phoenicis]|uniref:Uncharacterized protein n=1 Tax=Deinococcus phoenicis TaxID=1476583 RepID=A0A016QSJ2_9DEIO|nr:hypothetical protein [Deinococcus phoenicis]EYB69045.1 hypothetical protein DEIPH_ctg011orf0009 [Deinococcus phoenicis]
MDPERIPYMPWPIVSGLLNRLSMIEFRRHAHTALLAQVIGATMGGAKNTELGDYLLGFARLTETGKGGEVRLTLAGKQAEAMRLGLRLGVVSQRLLNLFSA